MAGHDTSISPPERRQLLIDSAVELLAESGTRGVTHQRTAHRAGVTAASSRHHFGTDTGLLHAAIRHRLQRWQAEVAAPFESAASADMDVPTRVSRYFETRRRDDAAQYLAVFTTAFTDPELQPAVRATTLQVELLMGRRLSQMGLPAPDRLAASVLALMFSAATRRRDGGLSDAEEVAILTRQVRELVDGSLGAQHSGS